MSVCEKKQNRKFRNAGQALKNDRKGLKRGMQRTLGAAGGVLGCLSVWVGLGWE